MSLLAEYISPDPLEPKRKETIEPCLVSERSTTASRYLRAQLSFEIVRMRARLIRGKLFSVDWPRKVFLPAGAQAFNLQVAADAQQVNPSTCLLPC